jgi:hypothetical protein
VTDPPPSDPERPRYNPRLWRLHMTYKSEKLQSAVKTVFFRRAFKANAGRSDYCKQGYTCPVREPAAPSTLVDLKLHIPHSIELCALALVLRID